MSTTTESLAALAAEIYETYHCRTRNDLQALLALAESAAPELVPAIAEVTNELLPHMLKEEQVLFPYVAQLELAVENGTTAPTPFFGTVKRPVRMMMFEHDRAVELLARLRTATNGFVPPPNANEALRELHRRLNVFEALTLDHIRVENDVYFPRAVTLEESAGSGVEFAQPGGACCAH